MAVETSSGWPATVGPNIQFMAFAGALLWGRLAGWVGAKRSVIISLFIWAGVTIYAYFGLKGPSRVLEFFLLGACIAIVEEAGKPQLYLHSANTKASGVTVSDAIMKIAKKI